ncbi:Hypothetical predicted protein [Paramuricea clavata]|uniref:Uncharacterized protein n=1 Tax=Paramuricea clavata TaxID=317549 RepID=A0A7D9D678_PARCT|nr:Hypothetical predicted protein [Paramuricea clavata]
MDEITNYISDEEELNEKIETENDEHDDDDDDDDDENDENNAENTPAIENNDKCDNEEEEDYSEEERNYSADDEEEINNEASALFLKQIWDAHCMTIQKQKQSKFLPATKKFLAAGFAQKEKMLNNNKQLISHMVFLCRNIANGKIPLNISECERALFTYISDKATHRSDVRLRLLEEFTVQYYCKLAIKQIEKSRGINSEDDDNGRRCKTFDVDRYRKIQHDDQKPRSISRKQANSKRGKTNNGRRGIN